MPHNRRRIFSKLPFFIIPIILLVGLIVMLLWNAILPDAIHVSKINYWQALGLLILCRILFGGFRGRPGWSGHRSEWHEKWKKMSDEERVKFREEWRQRRRRPGPESEAEQ